MSGCVAVGCTNSGKKGVRLFIFPANPERRKRWVVNCRRDNWQPTQHSKLCEVHFEQSQWEQHRADDWRKLKPNAVPTLFNVPNPPPQIGEDGVRRAKNEAKEKLSKITRKEKPQCTNESELNVLEPEISLMDVDELSSNSNFEELKILIKSLQDENKKLKDNLKEQIQNIEKDCSQLKKEKEELEKKIIDKEVQLQSFQKFLTEQQIESLNRDKMKQWDKETIMKALKMRFHLGVDGYDYIRSTKYPLPSLKTLSNRFRQYQVTPGILEDLNEPIAYKMSRMDPLDQYCTMVIDEMAIRENEDYDKLNKKFMGYVTLGDTTQLGSHITVVLIRGLKTPWKQIIAVEVTGANTKPNYSADLITRCIKFVETLGLTVVSITSDMGGNNQGFWTSMGVHAYSDGERCNKMTISDTTFCIIPDACHLLKSLRNALQKHKIYLPEEVMNSEDLPCSIVSSSYVTALWWAEINGNHDTRYLYHLKPADISPDGMEKMNVASAMRYFSETTAVAIETAIELKYLPPNAKTTAWFIRKVSSWFELVSSRVAQKGITRMNLDKKIEILEKMIGLFQNLRIGEPSYWKPLNWGMILCCLSLIDISRLLLRDGFSFLLLHRFTQDCLENVFSQIRRKCGLTPTVSLCLRAIKLISLSQITRTPKTTSYLTDSDEFLLEYFEKKKSEVPSKTITKSVSGIQVQDENVMDDEIFPTVISEEENLVPGLTLYDLNLIYKLAGGCVFAYLKKPICEKCKSFLNSNVVENHRYMIYLNRLNHGNLRKPNKSVFDLVMNIELLYRRWKDYILRHPCDVWINKVLTDVQIEFPKCEVCYDLKVFVANHFFKIKSFSLCTLNTCKRKRKNMYGTASKKKKV